jgi:hypothetical protein
MLRLSIALGLALAPVLAVPMTAAPSSSTRLSSSSLVSVAPEPDAKLRRLAVSAAVCARRTIDVPNARFLTVIDYSRPSTAPRLWVLDLSTGRVIFSELVAHGRGSGGNVADRFSNEPDSHASSLGMFLTEDAYVGTNGYSLRLRGLEPGINDRAIERAIVMHGAPYVQAGMERFGRLGRSWGCPAVRPAVARQLIDRIKQGTLLLAYYPAPQWLQQSRFLGECAPPGSVAASRVAANRMPLHTRAERGSVAPVAELSKQR